MTVEFISLINVWESSELFPGRAAPRRRLHPEVRPLPGGRRLRTTPWSPTTRPATTLHGLRDPSPPTPSASNPSSRCAPNPLPDRRRQSLATLDQLSGGRATCTSSPAAATRSRPARRLHHQGRALRPLRGVRQAAAPGLDRDPSPGNHDGRFYKFENFVAGFRPVNGTIPVSVGGSSRRRTGSAARSATSSACGASRWPRPGSRSTRSPRRPGSSGVRTPRGPG